MMLAKQERSQRFTGLARSLKATRALNAILQSSPKLFTESGAARFGGEVAQANARRVMRTLHAPRADHAPHAPHAPRVFEDDSSIAGMQNFWREFARADAAWEVRGVCCPLTGRLALETVLETVQSASRDWYCTHFCKSNTRPA